MFRIKICGITQADDARLACEAGADAIGLNFYPLSPRYVETREAEKVAAALPPGVLKIGVFVNSSSAEIRSIADRLGLDAVQLHGDESPEFLAELEGRAVIRAFRCAAGLQPAGAYLEQCRQRHCLPKTVLVDAFQKGQYGGTGAVADWQLLSDTRAELGALPLVLAGGLNSANVGAAIQIARPDGVDTASGVESSPGRKSPVLVQAFVRAAQEAFAALQQPH